MITMMGSMGAYMKNLKLQTQVDIKQSRGELGSHKALTEYLNGSKTGGEEEHKPDTRLRDIHTKLEAGGKLTPEERRYLQSRDPEAYQKLRSAEQEQKAFQQKLRQCRTKEEAQRLKMTYINSSLITVKSVENNSAIPKAKKLEIFMQEKQRCDRIEESAREFVRRGDYDKLPSEAEEQKAKKDAQKAEEAARPKAPEKTESPNTAEKPQKEAAEREKPLEKEEPIGEKPAVHVETPEEKKVKRARANASRRARYAQAVTAYQASISAAVPAAKIDTKG